MIRLVQGFTQTLFELAGKKTFIDLSKGIHHKILYWTSVKGCTFFWCVDNT